MLQEFCFECPAAPKAATPPHRQGRETAPAAMAAGLAHLPGLMWLDSALQCPGAVSLIAAAPELILQGNIAENWDAVETLLADKSSESGIASGGLYGWVGFDGQYTLGVYPEVLVYAHDEARWLEPGRLASYWRAGAMLDPHPPALGFEPQLSRDEFVCMVLKAREYIAAGDIYQVNLSHPWKAAWPAAADPLAAYFKLRAISPAPHAAYLDLAGVQVLSASPEMFLRISGRRIVTRPIKGTRPRFPSDPAKDDASRSDLQTSAKERAELLMITDLERNDLGQVCTFGSVRVPELWRLEAFPQVFHLVSTVRGELRPGISHAGAFKACFPGGSITGAPKRRALEIIRELEPHERGLYTGAIGGFGFNGESYWNIAIRTAVREGSEIRFHSGAGIVADSDPVCEFEETCHKAAGLLRLAEP